MEHLISLEVTIEVETSKGSQTERAERGEVDEGESIEEFAERVKAMILAWGAL